MSVKSGDQTADASFESIGPLDVISSKQQMATQCEYFRKIDDAKLKVLYQVVDNWSQANRVGRDFAKLFFTSSRSRAELRKDCQGKLPLDVEIDDIAADLAIRLQLRIDAGDLGVVDCDQLEQHTARLKGKYAPASMLLAVCAKEHPEILSGSLGGDGVGDDAPMKADTVNGGEFRGGNSDETILKDEATSAEPPAAEGDGLALDRAKSRLSPMLSWSRFWLGLRELPVRPRLADSTDEGGVRPATYRNLRSLFRRPRGDRRRESTRIRGVIPLVRNEGDSTRLDVGLSRSEEDFDRLSPAGYDLYLDEELRNRHFLAVGQTGSGKTTTLILPLLHADIANREKTVIVFDAKGELVSPTVAFARRFRGVDPLYVDFRDPERSLGWNPLAGVRSKGDAREVALRICSATEVGLSTGDSRFFFYSAVDLLTGIIVALVSDDVGAATLADALAVADLDVKTFEKFAAKHAVPELKRFAAYIGTSSHNAETVLADLRMRLGLWRDERVCAVTSPHELDMAALAERPTVLIVHVNEQEVELMKPLTNAFMTALFGTLLSASGKRADKSLAVPVSMIIEEFASAVGRIPELERRLNTIRQRRIAVTASIQSLSQIDLEYGQASHALLAGFSTKAFFANLTQEDAEYVSRCSGAMTIAKEETTYHSDQVTTFDGESAPSTRRTLRIAKRSLFTPDEVTSAAPRHRALRRAVTFQFPEHTMFQAFLTPSFRIPQIQGLLERTRRQDQSVPVRSEPLPEIPSRIAAAWAEGGGAVLSNAANWTTEQIRRRLDDVKSELQFSEVVDKSAGKWWIAFENENQERLPIVLRVAEELLGRKATIQEFFLAYVYSNTDNIQANLHFLDYSRLKKEEEVKKQAARKAAAPSEEAGSTAAVPEQSLDSDGNAVKSAKRRDRRRGRRSRSQTTSSPLKKETPEIVNRDAPLASIDDLFSELSSEVD
jgi:hypothetical protein